MRSPEDLERHLTQLLEQVAPDGAAVRAVGISVPGLVDDESGVSVYAPSWDWRSVPLRATLSRRWQLPVHLDNPLKALMVSELWHDPGAAEANWRWSTSDRCRCCDRVAGELYRGASNSAGEWGHHRRGCGRSRMSLRRNGLRRGVRRRAGTGGIHRADRARPSVGLFG